MTGPAPSSSRCSTSSSAFPEATPQSESTNSVSDASFGTPSKNVQHTRRYPAASHSRLTQPFRSPFKRSQSQRSTDEHPLPATARNRSSEKTTTSSSSSASVRKQRQALEARLLLLQQANKCLREDALLTLPKDISRWREAAQLAAQDLWRLTGAQAGDWSALSSVPSDGDHGLELLSSASGGTCNPHKRKAIESPESSNPPWLLRRSRSTSPGAEEEAAALRAVNDEKRPSAQSSASLAQAERQDSQGACSDGSLPDLSELLRRSQSVLGTTSSPRPRQSLLDTPLQRPVALPAPPIGPGIERKWNIGTMLDMLGADKSTLEWDVEEEEFREPAAPPNHSTGSSRRSSS